MWQVTQACDIISGDVGRVGVVVAGAEEVKFKPSDIISKLQLRKIVGIYTILGYKKLDFSKSMKILRVPLSNGYNIEPNFFVNHTMMEIENLQFVNRLPPHHVHYPQNMLDTKW